MALNMNNLDHDSNNNSNNNNNNNNIANNGGDAGDDTNNEGNTILRGFLNELFLERVGSGTATSTSNGKGSNNNSGSSDDDAACESSDSVSLSSNESSAYRNHGNRNGDDSPSRGRRRRLRFFQRRQQRQQQQPQQQQQDEKRQERRPQRASFPNIGNKTKTPGIVVRFSVAPDNARMLRTRSSPLGQMSTSVSSYLNYTTAGSNTTSCLPIVSTSVRGLGSRNTISDASVKQWRDSRKQRQRNKNGTINETSSKGLPVVSPTKEHQHQNRHKDSRWSTTGGTGTFGARTNRTPTDQSQGRNKSDHKKKTKKTKTTTRRKIRGEPSGFLSTSSAIDTAVALVTAPTESGCVGVDTDPDGCVYGSQSDADTEEFFLRSNDSDIEEDESSDSSISIASFATEMSNHNSNNNNAIPSHEGPAGTTEFSSVLGGMPRIPRRTLDLDLVLDGTKKKKNISLNSYFGKAPLQRSRSEESLTISSFGSSIHQQQQHRHYQDHLQNHHSHPLPRRNYHREPQETVQKLWRSSDPLARWEATITTNPSIRDLSMSSPSQPRRIPSGGGISRSAGRSLGRWNHPEDSYSCYESHCGSGHSDRGACIESDIESDTSDSSSQTEDQGEQERIVRHRLESEDAEKNTTSGMGCRDAVNALKSNGKQNNNKNESDGRLSKFSTADEEHSLTATLGTASMTSASEAIHNNASNGWNSSLSSSSSYSSFSTSLATTVAAYENHTEDNTGANGTTNQNSKDLRILPPPCRAASAFVSSPSCSSKKAATSPSSLPRRTHLALPDSLRKLPGQGVVHGKSLRTKRQKARLSSASSQQEPTRAGRQSRQGSVFGGGTELGDSRTKERRNREEPAIHRHLFLLHNSGTKGGSLKMLEDGNTMH